VTAVRPLAAVRDFRRFAAPYVRRYGFIGGWRLALQLRATWTREAGAVVGLSVPGLRGKAWIRAKTSDLAVFQQIVVDREQQVELAAAPRTIVDAGANIGLASAVWAARYPEARILAIEPDAGNFALLRRNTRRYPGVTAVRAGLWCRGGHVRIENPEAEPWAFRVGEADAGDASAVVALTVGDAIGSLGGDRIDVLKLDIEGAELDIFSAADLGWLDRVGTIVVELHDRLRPGCTEALERALGGRSTRRRRQGEFTVVELDRAGDRPDDRGGHR
jgi:FkbM family methyltransferase